MSEMKTNYSFHDQIDFVQSKRTWVIRKFIEIAVNTLDHFSTHDGMKSAQRVASPPQILTRSWHSDDGHLSGAFETAQRVDTRRSFELSSTEIQASNRQDFFACDDTYTLP